MLYYKFSENRLFILNEYWLFIPTMLISDYLIIRHIKSRRAKIQQLEELKIKLEHYEKVHKIMALTLTGLSCYTLMLRGGSDFIDVDYLRKCGIEEGLRYVNNDRLRKIIHSVYGNKRKRKVIFITATALCHLSSLYGKDFLAFPIPIGDFGITNLYQTLRKGVVTILLGAAGPLFVVGGPMALTVAAILVTYGLRLAFSNPDKILTEFIDKDIPAKNIEPRIADLPDVVSVNFRDKVRMTTPEPPKGECLLAEQTLFNPSYKVKAADDISNIITDVAPDLSYDDVVNMQDVTGLDRVKFSDILDLGSEACSISKTRSGKTVNFLDMFPDPKDIAETEKWEASEIINKVPKNMNLRTRK